MVPRVTEFTTTTSGNYDLYGGYLIVPAYPGQGSINITTDITQHDGPPTPLGVFQLDG